MIPTQIRYWAFVLVGTYWIISVQCSFAETYKQLPPQGIELPNHVLDDLKRNTQDLRSSLDRAVLLAKDSASWRGDVEVFLRAVELAIEQNLFYKPQDADAALRMLKIGSDRLAAAVTGQRGIELLAIGSVGKAQGRTLAGGFVSQIDGSIQPFGLVIPEIPLKTKDTLFRLDVWLHGRGDETTEVPFLIERLEKLGQYAPPGVIVLHPFGRHCNAFKFAGETDVYEAIHHVKKTLPIDSKRISIRGFSMGGAGVWHLAAHDPGRWFAANPGAGFVDTIKYQGWDKKVPYEPGDWGRRLMNWYDVPPWVDNLSNTHVISYSGEVDKQRESAELMIAVAKASPVLIDKGFEIKQVIGKDMGHKIDDVSAVLMDAQLAALEADAGKQLRTKIHFVTYTLRYHQVDWLSIEGMTEHWQPATIDAAIENPTTIRITTKNVSSLRLDFSRDGWPNKSGYLQVIIDGQELDGPAVMQGKPSRTQWSKRDNDWEEVDPQSLGVIKRPGMQGPIDDAFTSSFLFVFKFAINKSLNHSVSTRTTRQYE